jgi:hypothetical protein
MIMYHQNCHSHSRLEVQGVSYLFQIQRNRQFLDKVASSFLASNY